MRTLCCSMMVVSISAFAGCGSKAPFDVAQTTGVVMCEGQPVPFAMVYFEPLTSGKKAVVGRQGIGLADETGRFTVSTYGEKDGAVVGKHRVRVDRPRREGRTDPPCPCTLNSEIDVANLSVVAGETNDFEIVLKPKAPTDKKRPPGPDEDD